MAARARGYQSSIGFQPVFLRCLGRSLPAGAPEEGKRQRGLAPEEGTGQIRALEGSRLRLPGALHVSAMGFAAGKATPLQARRHAER
jgi:hypothetical protein